MIEVFVFGSNLAGIHGRGSARAAMVNHGAVLGVGVGFKGRSYAIPTKDANLKTLPLDRIEHYVSEFILFARQYPEMRFNIVAIGCGLAGYKPAQIAPMFTNAPSNCVLPEEFMQ